MQFSQSKLNPTHVKMTPHPCPTQDDSACLQKQSVTLKTNEANKLKGGFWCFTRQRFHDTYSDNCQKHFSGYTQAILFII